MIPTHTPVKTDGFGLGEEVSFGIKAENMAVVAHILRSQLYSDPIMAVLREYSTNATDAHIMSNQPKRPILVTLPSRLSPILKIRDYGNGLTVDEIREIYVSYGASTKRATNEATGMLGLGSKSGFAYGDSFIVVSHNNGIAISYNAYIDETKVGRCVKLAENPTDENGIEIQIPVKPNDVETFINKAFYLYRFFKVHPILADLPPDKETAWLKTCAELSAPLLKGANWRVYEAFSTQKLNYNNNSPSYFVMGNIGYPVPSNMAELCDIKDAKISSFVRNIASNCGLWIDVPIGSAEIAASREAIQFSNHTKAGLSPIIQKVYDGIVEQVNLRYKSCKSLWEAKIMYSQTHDYGSPLYYLQSSVGNGNVVWNGVRVSSSDCSTLGDDARMKVTSYSKFNRHRRHGSLSRMKSTPVGMYFKASDKTMVLENDLADPSNGIANRVVDLVETGKYSEVIVVNFLDSTAKAEWIKNTNYDGPLESLAALPAFPLSKYYGKTSRTNAGSTVVRTKHSKEVFQLDTVVKMNTYASDDWIEDSTIDVETDAFCYILIDRFNYTMQTDTKTYSADLLKRANELRQSLTELKEAGYDVSVKVYGLKMKAFIAAQKNPKATHITEFAKDAITRRLKGAPSLCTSLSDATFFSAVSHFDPWLVGLFEVCLSHKKEYFAKLDKNSPLLFPVEQYEILKKGFSNKARETYEAHASVFRDFSFNFATVSKTSVSLSNADMDKLKEYYKEMAAFSELHSRHSLNDPDLIKNLPFFINALEKVKGKMA